MASVGIRRFKGAAASQLPATYIPKTGIQSGTQTTTGTVRSVSFPAAFAAAPVVTVNASGAAYYAAISGTPTPTGFSYVLYDAAGAAVSSSAPAFWIAAGAES